MTSRTICNYIKRIGYSYKKTFIHPKRNENARKEFIETIQKVAKDKIIWLDESGIEDNIIKDYGFSLKGERCYGKKSYQYKKRISMIAGLNDRQIMAPFIFNNTCNKEVFETYIEQVLLPKLKFGQIIVMVEKLL